MTIGSACLQRSIKQLDAATSATVKEARRTPVIVYRYKLPWVALVSYDLWVEANDLSTLVPEGHPLRSLRHCVDEVLIGVDFKEFVGLAMSLVLSHSTPASPNPEYVTMLIKCMILQIMYSLDTEAKVHGVLRFNMANRWFVGLSRFCDKPPSIGVFADDLRKLWGDVRILHLVISCLVQANLNELPHDEFRIDHRRIQSLRDKLACEAKA